MSNEHDIKKDPTFTSTHWSQVVTAADASSPRAAEALAQLCRTYWYPLYAFVRRQGHSKEDAEDLTQGFFEMLLTRNALKTVRADRGKLRSFLLSALQNLGYHRPLAEKAADTALAAGGEPTFEVALKAALRELMRSR